MTARWFTVAILVLFTSVATAVEVRFDPVAESVYAHVGDIGARSVTNEGLNANLGLVVTAAGAVLIDSGATWRNVRDSGDRLSALRSLLRAAADDTLPTLPTLPTRLIDGHDTRLTLGGTVFELCHRGGCHTPGDMVVWLPQAQGAVAGDIVYVDRLLAVLPVSSTKAWFDAYAALERPAPKRIVPGHGRVSDLAADLRSIRTGMGTKRSVWRPWMGRAAQSVRSIDSVPALVHSTVGELFGAPHELPAHLLGGAKSAVDFVVGQR